MGRGELEMPKHLQRHRHRSQASSMPSEWTTARFTVELRASRNSPRTPEFPQTDGAIATLRC